MGNRWIDRAKWPVTLALAAFAWFAASQLPHRIAVLAHRPATWLPMAGGAACYFLAWALWLRSSKTAAWITVMEHELAHAIASFATLNGVHRLHADSSGEGHVLVGNGGNWIVFAAPYIVPTSLLLPALAMAAMPLHAFVCFLFGTALAFHIHTTVAETHSAQTDLKRIGWPTSFVLLPAGHIVCALAMAGVLTGTQQGMANAWSQAAQAARKAVHTAGMARRR